MALCIQTPCSLQWRLDELEKIIDSMEDEIEEAITHQNLQTDHNYTNIVLRTAGKSLYLYVHVATVAQNIARGNTSHQKNGTKLQIN